MPNAEERRLLFLEGARSAESHAENKPGIYCYISKLKSRM